MKYAIANVCDRDIQIVRQFALNAGIPGLRVRVLSWIAAELMQNAGGIEYGGTKRRRLGHTQRGAVPQAISRNVGAQRIHVGKTGKQIAVADGEFVIAVLVGSAIQEI